MVFLNCLHLIVQSTFFLLALSARTLIRTDPIQIDPLECNIEPDPVYAIHLGHDFLSVAYAHSHDNVSTLLAEQVHSSPDLGEYASYIYRLRKQYMEERSARQQQKQNRDRAKPYLDAITFLVRDIFELICEELAATPDPSYPRFVSAIKMGCTGIKSTQNTYHSFSSWVKESISSLWGRPEEIKPRVSTEDATRAFGKAFEAIKGLMQEHSEGPIELKSAVIVYPTFFNYELRCLAIQAAHDAGISRAFPITPQTLVTEYDDVILNASSEMEIDLWEEILVVDQGFFHFELRTEGSGRRCHVESPNDYFSAFRISKIQLNRILSSNKYLEEQIKQGADQVDLWEAVGEAAWKLKQQRDLNIKGEMGGEDVLDEWPLDLDDWWIGEKEKVTFRWEDVLAAEDEYVKELEEMLDAALLQLESEGHCPCEDPSSFVMNTAVILGSYYDISLLERAIRRVVGNDTRIIQGRPGWPNTFVAELGARVAFRISENIRDELKSDCIRELQDKEYERQWEAWREQWPEGHNEL